MRLKFGTLIVLLISGCSNAEMSQSADEKAENQQSSTREIKAEEKRSVEMDLQGKWVIVEANVSGTEVPSMQGGIATIAGNEISIQFGGQSTRSMLKFHENTDPIRFEAKSDAGETSYAILKMDGDQLKVCTALSGSDFPESFDPGPGLMVVTYQREKESR